MTTPPDLRRPGRAPGAHWWGSLRAALRTQEQLWDLYLSGAATSGREARAALGEPPLRWSGSRLRGSVLPALD